MIRDFTVENFTVDLEFFITDLNHEAYGAGLRRRYGLVELF
jgi:hypothetical protein